MTSRKFGPACPGAMRPESTEPRFVAQVDLLLFGGSYSGCRCFIQYGPEGTKRRNRVHEIIKVDWFDYEGVDTILVPRDEVGLLP